LIRRPKTLKAANLMEDGRAALTHLPSMGVVLILEAAMVVVVAGETKGH
jgi:hypothetical protein